MRFFPLSSLNREGIDRLEVCSVGRGRVVPGGSVLNLGLLDARRFRGLLVGDLGGGTSETCVLGGGAVFRMVGSATSAGAVDGEALDFCLL